MEDSKEQMEKNVKKERTGTKDSVITSAKIKVTMETEIKTRIKKFNKHKNKHHLKKQQVQIYSNIFTENQTLTENWDQNTPFQNKRDS